jgi:hypothetical protein
VVSDLSPAEAFEDDSSAEELVEADSDDFAEDDDDDEESLPHAASARIITATSRSDTVFLKYFT